MDDGFDVVPIGVEHEGALVARVVAALARRTVFPLAGRDSDPMELVNCAPVSGGIRTSVSPTRPRRRQKPT